ncbi:MAG: BrnT family toxin [Thermodesulfovibrionales bacterium]
MKFEWDKEKNKANIRKHGFDLADAQELFLGTAPLLVTYDSRVDYGEERWKGIGLLCGVLVVAVVFAERENDTIRIISLRKADALERKEYEAEIKNRLGQG